MDERLLQVRDYAGEGFMPLINFGSWRVAMLRARADTRAAGMQTLERHMETDEVFVLAGGKAILLIGGDAAQTGEIATAPMEFGKIYNVRRAVWHGILLNADASILIVENADTSTTNSQYSRLTSDQQSRILEIEKRAGI